MTRAPTPEPPPPDEPHATPRAAAEKAARTAREADALRANLRRRKDQQRARQDGEDPKPG